MITQQRPFVSVFNAIEQAREEAGIKEDQPLFKKRRWFESLIADAEEKNVLIWEHPEFGKLQFRVKNTRSLTNFESEGEAMWAEAFFKGEPREVEVLIEALPQDGVTVLRYQGKQGEHTVEVTGKDIQPLKVPVEWLTPAAPKGGVTRYPSVREAHKDNLDIVFVNSKGVFVQVEVGVTARFGKFSIAVQEMCCEQVTRTTHEKAANINSTSVPAGQWTAVVVPVYPENAYEGNDYVKTFGPSVINHALSRGAFVPLSRAIAAKWQEPDTKLPEELKDNVWQLATVQFFNLAWLAGAGFAKLEDGRSVFLHWKSIQHENGGSIASRGQFPFLSRMSRIAVKVEEKSGKLKAVAIRKI